MSTDKRIGWFSTGRDEAACKLLSTVYSAMSGDTPGRLVSVFCNREPKETTESDRFLDLVRSYHIPVVCLSSRRFWKAQGADQPYASETLPQWRLDYDQEVLRLVQPFSPDLTVLAGYMLIASPVLCQRLAMINLHPAAPGGPKGTWQQVVWQLIQEWATTSGVMMHLVTPELDRGPAVTYCTYSLRGGELDGLWRQVGDTPINDLQAEFGGSLPLFQAIRRRGLAREFPLIVSTLRAYCQGHFRLEWGRVVDERGRPRPAVDLTAEVEATLRGVPLP